MWNQSHLLALPADLSGDPAIPPQRGQLMRRCQSHSCTISELIEKVDNQHYLEWLVSGKLQKNRKPSLGITNFGIP